MQCSTAQDGTAPRCLPSPAAAEASPAGELLGDRALRVQPLHATFRFELATQSCPADVHLIGRDELQHGK